MSNNVYKDFLEALDSVEPTFSDEYLAQILTLVFVEGGENEKWVQSQRLNAVIQLAQKRFNIFGGGKVSRKHSNMLKHYTAELTIDSDCDWAVRLRKEYGLKKCR